MYRSVPTTAADLTLSGDLLVLEAQFESRGHFGTLAVTCRPNHTTLRQRYGVLVSALLRWFVLNRAVRETSGALRSIVTRRCSADNRASSIWHGSSYPSRIRRSYG